MQGCRRRCDTVPSRVRPRRFLMSGSACLLMPLPRAPRVLASLPAHHNLTIPSRQLQRPLPRQIEAHGTLVNERLPDRAVALRLDGGLLVVLLIVLLVRWMLHNGSSSGSSSGSSGSSGAVVGSSAAGKPIVPAACHRRHTSTSTAGLSPASLRFALPLSAAAARSCCRCRSRGARGAPTGGLAWETAGRGGLPRLGLRNIYAGSGLPHEGDVLHDRSVRVATVTEHEALHDARVPFPYGGFQHRNKRCPYLTSHHVSVAARVAKATITRNLAQAVVRLKTGSTESQAERKRKARQTIRNKKSSVRAVSQSAACVARTHSHGRDDANNNPTIKHRTDKTCSKHTVDTMRPRRPVRILK